MANCNLSGKNCTLFDSGQSFKINKEWKKRKSQLYLKILGSIKGGNDDSKYNEDADSSRTVSHWSSPFS